MIATVGYERRTIDQLMDLLKGVHVSCLLDVRIRAGSRKKGFSKTALSEHCAYNGLRYVHERDLGTPRWIMQKFRNTGVYDWDAYLEFLLQQTDALDRAAIIATAETVCLLCYERDYRECHRRFVAEELSKRSGLKVKHL